LVVGGAQAAATELTRSLVFWENMICGATSRSIAQTVMHPANTMKTILQNARGPHRPTIATLLQPSNFRRLTVGAGANFLLSMPHGAVNFAVLELVRARMSTFVRSHQSLSSVERRFGFGLDFLSSSISTVACSIVSTPQMMITDNIMAGNYPNLLAAITGLAQSRGILGFYSGWWPGLVGKIPSYAFTWTFFQQLKALRLRLTNNRPAKDWENSAMGCLASAATVCLMIPMDTIKTRLVSQAGRAATSEVFYTGIADCAVRVFREEGMGTFYRGLPPRLVSVVPMIGIQFGVYEFMKRLMLARHVTVIATPSPATKPPSKDTTAPPPLLHEHHATVTSSSTSLEEAMMEVAASPEHPFPAPQFSMRDEEPTVPKKAKKHR
jgi:Mitochondrial carrier protein